MPLASLTCRLTLPAGWPHAPETKSIAGSAIRRFMLLILPPALGLSPLRNPCPAPGVYSGCVADSSISVQEETMKLAFTLMLILAAGLSAAAQKNDVDI